MLTVMCIVYSANACIKIMSRISKGSFRKKGLSVTASVADMRRDSLEAEGVGWGGSMSFTGRSLAVFW